MEADKKRKPIKTSEYLKYTFTAAERHENARTLARKTQALEEIELRKKRLMADIKAEQEKSVEEVQKLARFVNDEYDYRMIDCEVELHTPRTGMKTLIRTDTGEVVKEMAMTTSEMQENLPFEEQVEDPPATIPEPELQSDAPAPADVAPKPDPNLDFGPRAEGGIRNP